MTNPIYTARWLTTPYKTERECVSFCGKFQYKTAKKATLYCSALGIYKAEINGRRVSDIIFAPGWTEADERLMYQEYDVTDMLSDGENELKITVGCGWRRHNQKNNEYAYLPHDGIAAIAAVVFEYENGTCDWIITDEQNWQTERTRTIFADLFEGETYDATYKIPPRDGVCGIPHRHNILIPQMCEPIREQEHIKPVALIKTPNGENVLDFGQNMTGYVSFKICGKAGEHAIIEHAEVLDKDGNFYNANYRKATSKIEFICDGKEHIFKPEFTFYGFRYIRLTEWHGAINPDDFEAIVIHSDLERTGYFSCSDESINRLYHNIIWGQKSNFVDVPTDCPQRDERMGWTGDAQVFCRCASLNYRVDKFFRKWLYDMACAQRPTGAIPNIIPNGYNVATPSAAWSDSAAIVPWQMYMTYGDESFIEQCFPMIKTWVDYSYDNPDYITSDRHYGDWLATDVDGSLNGATKKEFIARAFRYRSTEILIKCAGLVGYNAEKYENLLKSEKEAFIKMYFDGNEIKEKTQTSCVLALTFGLTPDKAQTAKELVGLIRANGNRLSTGFVGTPYIMHALTDNGYADIAYGLLFQRRCPSWLYSVDRGATTMWEHWDGIKEDGTFWSETMNSFNHYAYGAVGDWLYGDVAGINTVESAPGFAEIRFAPHITDRMTFAAASVKTKYGTVESKWERKSDKTVYTFTVPEGVGAFAEIGTKKYTLHCGINEISD